MKWMITKDLIFDPKWDERTRVGFNNFNGTLDVEKELPVKFRLLDDDKIVYYEGQMAKCDTEAIFAPLDWAMNDAGCTELQIFEKGSWVSV